MSSLLRDSVLKPATLKRYTACVHTFTAYCLSIGENPPTVEDFDCVFSDYIDGVYEGGGWKNLHSPQSRPPLTWEVTVTLSVCMAKSGYPEHALATLLAFDTYLRISEYVNMGVKDVAVPGDPRMG